MSKLKKEKGSITTIVVVTIMFFITILSTSYAITASLRQSQIKSQLAVKEAYEEDVNNVNEIVKQLAYTGSGLEINSEEVQELIKQIKLSIYPIGSIYISTSSTNPSEFIGGEWESYGEGRTLIGAGTGTDSNSESVTFTANEKGGEYNHTLTIAEMPSHTHIQNAHTHIVWSYITGYSGWDMTTVNRSRYVLDWNYLKNQNLSNSYSTNMSYNNYIYDASSETATNQNTGGSESHNNIQPYIVTYMWKRVK